jgi:transposase
MDVIHRRCCGLDVHRKTVVACVRVMEGAGRAHGAVRTFGTMTGELLALSDGLAASGVSHVAMESTGVFWKPVWNLLHGHFDLLLVNAQHIKQVPGGKTDVKDCEWIARLPQHGLLKASFAPPQPVRELRELTRQRAKLIQERASASNRIHKVLEDANIKLGAVLSEPLGVSGRTMPRAMIEGEESPERLAAMAHVRLPPKLPRLQLALAGRASANHRFPLKRLMAHGEFLESEIALFDRQIEEHLLPFQEEVALLLSIPGIQRRSAENLIAEIGPDMNQFPTAGQMTSWAGICPGNNESGGKRRRAKTPKGTRWLRRTLGSRTHEGHLLLRAILAAGSQARCQTSHCRCRSWPAAQRARRAHLQTPLPGSWRGLLPAPKSRAPDPLPRPQTRTAGKPGAPHANPPCRLSVILFTL